VTSWKFGSSSIAADFVGVAIFFFWPARRLPRGLPNSADHFGLVIVEGRGTPMIRPELGRLILILS
jgi:hypothetical protein